MKILFTRHGESQANTRHIISNRNLPHLLTEKGLSQAQALAETLAGLNVHKIYASPIPRASQTAAIVAERLALPVLISPALLEFDCGEMEGRGDAAAWAAHQAVTRAWDEERDYERRIPGGESFNDMQARFLPFIEGLITENKQLPGEILLISHGGMLLQMLPLVLANIDRPFTASHPLGNCVLVTAQLEATRLVCTAWPGIQFQ